MDVLRPEDVIFYSLMATSQNEEVKELVDRESISIQDQDEQEFLREAERIDRQDMQEIG